jgi:hypothetical protein
MISFRPFSSAADFHFPLSAFDAFRLFSSPPLFSPTLYASLSPPPFRRLRRRRFRLSTYFFATPPFRLRLFDYAADATPTFSFSFRFRRHAIIFFISMPSMITFRHYAAALRPPMPLSPLTPSFHCR